MVFSLGFGIGLIIGFIGSLLFCKYHRYKLNELERKQKELLLKMKEIQKELRIYE
jgi:hypothetical protein